VVENETFPKAGVDEHTLINFLRVSPLVSTSIK